MSRLSEKYLNPEGIMGMLMIGIAFFLPVHQKVVIPLIALLGITAIYSWIRKGVRPLKKAYWPFILLFAFYLIGLIFTTNFDYGLKDIETRLTFVLFPLFLGLTKFSKPLPFKPIVVALTLGCLVNIALCFYFAGDCYEETGWIECYEGVRLSHNMHPTYFALYLIVAGVFFAVVMLREGRSWGKMTLVILVELVFLAMVYRLYSLGPWLALAGMLAVLLYAYFHFRDQKRYFLFGVLLMGLLGWLAISNLSFIKHDYDAVAAELGAYFEDEQAYIQANKHDISSINTRIIIWNSSLEVIANHPFGVGTGDMKDELLGYYRSKGMDEYAEAQLNPHCQYMQTAIAIGIPAALYLIGILIYYLVLGFQRKNVCLIALISLFGISCMVESVLERQWGILFFMFFLSVLLRYFEEDQNTEVVN